MRHFRMPTNQNLKNLAILQKHIGSILREISKHEEEDRRRANSAGTILCHGSKRILRKSKKRIAISKLTTNQKHNSKKGNLNSSSKPRRCNAKQSLNKGNLTCSSCNVNSKTVQTHLEHLGAHGNSPVSCLKCRQSFQNNDSFTWHSLYSCSANVIYRCSQCQRTFNHKKDISRHFSAHRRNNCPYCQKPIALRKSLVKHLLTFHQVQLEKYILNCDLCDKSFVKRHSLYYHLQKHLKDKIVCLQCGHQSLSEEESEEHLKKHNEAKKYKCPTCNTYFCRKQQYLFHMKGHNMYKCITCNQSYGSKQQIRCHKRNGHVVEGLHPRYICPYCPNNFQKRIRLMQHLKKHPDTVPPLRCKYCDKSFPSSSLYFKHCLLVSHKKFLTEVTKFKCDICDKQFTKEDLVDKHRYHDHGVAKEPFSCQHCDFKTHYKNNYERHELLHVNKEKNFQCDHCSKTFFTLASLKDHISYNHHQGKKFSCEECGKSFKRSSELTRHKATHSDTRPFTCSMCSTTFKRTTHLKRHEINIHQIKSNKRTGKTSLVSSNQNILQEVTPRSDLKENDDTHNATSVPSIQSCLSNTAEDLRLVMQENLVTLESEAFIEEIADPSYDFLVHLTTDEHADIDILDLSNVGEFR